MGEVDWYRVIEEAARLGVADVQFIGGEPTLFPWLAGLIGHARGRGLGVEVFSNLVHVPPALWEVFEAQGVALATSWYSDDPDEHAAITGRPVHARTAANIAEALRRSIPLRVGVIGVIDGQRSAAAIETLVGLGVDPDRIGYDDLRQVGCGVRDSAPGPDQLCGGCADGVLAVSPSGEVWPCVFSRWMPVGNVRDASLVEIPNGSAAAQARAALAGVFAARETEACNPRCGPNCNPIGCGPRWEPMTACKPKQCKPADGFCSPNYPGPRERCNPRQETCRPKQCKPWSPK